MRQIIVHLILILSLGSAGTVYASIYSQRGFYDIEQYQLENGMRVVLKKRGDARNVSLRVGVGVGLLNFPCEKRELPHFLEHLLFTGTTKYSETELDHRISNHGGSWNAATSLYQTIYKVDIFSEYLNVGLENLFEIIADPTITEKNVEISRNILYREAGGRPSQFRRWLYTHGVGVTANVNAINVVWPGFNYRCDILSDAHDITREEIMQTFQHYYVASNMVLVVVGDFDPIQIRSMIENTFGQLAKSSFKVKQIPPPAPPQGFKTVTGLFSPILDTEGSVRLMFRTQGYASQDHYALNVLRSYLSKRIYEELRVERGLAYSPSARNISLDNTGVFTVSATTDFANMQQVTKLLRGIIESVSTHGPNQQEIEDTKRGMLLDNAGGVESNASFASYYVDHVNELDQFGTFVNEEDQIEAVTAEDVVRVAKTYFHPDNGVLALESPTLTYTQFFIVLGILVALLPMGIWRIYARMRKRIST